MKHIQPEVKVIVILLLFLLVMNCLTECLFNKMMIAMGVLDKKNRIYHGVSSALRILWIYMCAWLAASMPVLLIGLFILLFLNVIPYHNRSVRMNNFTMIIYLMYISLLMTVIGCGGLIGFPMEDMLQDIVARVIVLNTTFVIFNVICFFLLRYHPDILWREDYDRFKVVIYTRFLFICVVYHILDSIIVSVYQLSQVGYLLLVSGDVLILFLIFNFLNYNFVFEKSASMRRKYEEDEILIAQKFFEKEELKKLSEFDSLTNTYNRREICSIMSAYIRSGHKLLCVFIDLDGLKRINDKYGHRFGDLMLKRFADACTSLMEERDYLARIGGDEFLLVFLDQEIEDIEKRIGELQSKLLETDNEEEKIYFSYGISYDEDSVESYIHSADQKMYACKNKKR